MRPSYLQLLAFLFALACLPTLARGQSGFDDDRVMLQGFYWESYRHGHADHPEFADKKWYVLLKELAPEIRDARFNLVWLPPPSYAGVKSAGYNPKEYFRLDNTYGSFAQHRAMLEALLSQGVEPVADIVINHREGTGGWAIFKNPDWPLNTITKHDEAFKNPDSEAVGTDVSLRGAEEEKPDYASHGGTTYGYDAFRDLDHTNKQVRKDIIRYLLQLKSAGYRGWRYDMVHGYHARHLALYNKRSQPTFSVGEYEWDRHNDERGWIWHTATTPGDLKTSSNGFDFTTLWTLKGNKGNYRALYGLGTGGLGLVGDTTDAQPWKQRAVTFLENHDTGYRTNEDGQPQKNHEHDTFQNNWEVEQAYAYILTHPGVPTVYWKHYFDWGSDLKWRLKALINARKAAGVHSGSKIHLQDNARLKGVYAARVEGTKGGLYVRVGGSDVEWQPSDSSYSDYREYARGTGWKVWVKLPGNPEVVQAPLAAAIPVPEYKKADEITVPDSWIDP